MKKRFLSIALVLCMVLAVLPTAVIVLAATPTGTALTQDNISSYTNLTGGSTESEMAYYYLSENVTITSTITVTGCVTLDLNGHVLKMTGSGSVIHVGSSAVTLTINDSNKTATHTDTTLPNGGVITGGTGYVSSGNRRGGGIYVESGSVTINGGTISGCTASYGGGIYVDNGNVTMNGGTISGCTATNETASNGVQNNGIFILSGGTISNVYTKIGSYFKFTKGSISSSYNCFKGKLEVTPVDGDDENVSFSASEQTYFGNNPDTVINGGTFFGYIGYYSGKINGGVFSGKVHIYNGGTINDGTFHGTISCTNGTITGGTFNSEARLSTDSSISGGIFNSELKVNNVSISGGVFYDKISLVGYDGYRVTGGTFYGGLDEYNISSSVSYNKVVFDTDGGSDEIPAQYFVNTTSAKALKPADPSRDGYTFLGWYEKDTNGELKDTAFDFANTKVTGDITLYAKWVCIHSGGTADCTHKAVCTVCGEEYGSTNPDNHNFSWESENGQYWQRCTICGDETAKKDIPKITINGADKVCRTQNYKFSFTLPEGSKNAQYGYSFEYMGSGAVTPNYENGVYYGTVSSTSYPDGETTFKAFVIAETADGYEYSVSKTVTIVNEHTGGTADCTHKAKCEICGEEYGEVDNSNHNLEYTKGNAATTEAEGNTEYWHCEDCDKYFSDKDGKNEIKLADTVIAKLPKTDNNNETPKTGDNSHMALWFVLALLSGSALAGTAAYRRKKKEN